LGKIVALFGSANSEAISFWKWPDFGKAVWCLASDNHGCCQATKLDRNMRAKIVTAFVPLEGMLHFKPEDYHAYADRMEKAAAGRFRRYNPYPLEACWLYDWLEKRDWLELPPATNAAPDRYPTPNHFVKSNIVQHQRTTWMAMAAAEDPATDVLIWLDYALLKQGWQWDGHPGVEEHHITEFLTKIENSRFQDIPFPGIWPRGPIDDRGDNWRFCGSTHIIPRRWLHYVDWYYKFECKRFVERTKTVPLDLPIWATLEQTTNLPFRFYQANHDATQLTAFPG